MHVFMHYAFQASSLSTLLGRIEERRLALGLSQLAVAIRLGITQPHYSKVVGGVARLTPEMADAMHAWIADTPTPTERSDRRSSRIRTLTRSIERQLRELNALVGEEGAGRRAPRLARQRKEG